MDEYIKNLIKERDFYLKQYTHYFDECNKLRLELAQRTFDEATRFRETTSSASYDISGA
jgi:hypothetical protein